MYLVETWLIVDKYGAAENRTHTMVHSIIITHSVDRVQEQKVINYENYKLSNETFIYVFVQLFEIKVISSFHVANCQSCSLFSYLNLT